MALLKEYHNKHQNLCLSKADFRFKSLPAYGAIKLIDFELFKKHGRYPYYFEESCTQMTITADKLDFENSYVIFVSHCWQHTINGSTPDTPENDQYKVCISGLQNLRDTLLLEFKNLYLWIDCCCLDLYRPVSDEIIVSTTLVEKQVAIPNTYNLSLCTIFHCADCMFTPLYDPDTKWELTDRLVMNNFHGSYTAIPWRGSAKESTEEGDLAGRKPAANYNSSYMLRAWCRLEMFYCANIPILGEEILFEPNNVNVIATNSRSITTTTQCKDNDINMQQKLSRDTNRRELMKGKLKIRSLHGQRPHLVYGSYEQRLGLSAMILPPLSNKLLNLYNPMTGYISHNGVQCIVSSCCSSNNDSRENNSVHLLHRLIEELQQYILLTERHREMEESEARGGILDDNGDRYRGEMNAEYERHGQGVCKYANGDIYEGK